MFSIFFGHSFFPYPSWVQRTNRFLSKTTQTQLILIIIIFWALSRPHRFLRKIFWTLFWLNISQISSSVQCTNRSSSTTTKTQIILIFIIFWTLSRPYQFFWEKIRIFFGLTSPPILAEFNALIGFCLGQPWLNLYSFSSYFELFPDFTNFLEKIFF
jgi:hypothetical protein